MNWSKWRKVSWIDTRARFVSQIGASGRLLDLGSSDGSTLNHIAELRPDLSIASADISGEPNRYPEGTDFRRADFDADPLPWSDGTFDAVTCMHVVEHLLNPAYLVAEASRVLKPGGRLYVETPHPKSLTMKSPVGPGTEHVTVNFFDDKTHVRPVEVAELATAAKKSGMSVVKSGISRNWLFAASFPALYVVRNRTRARYVSQLHWCGWSAYIIASRNQE